MKILRIVMMVIICGTAINALADVSYTVTVTNEEDKALRATVTDPHEWIQHAIKDKARRCVDRIIEEETSLNYKKLDETTKLTTIDGLTLETRVDKDARLAAEAAAEIEAAK